MSWRWGAATAVGMVVVALVTVVSGPALGAGPDTTSGGSVGAMAAMVVAPGAETPVERGQLLTVTLTGWPSGGPVTVAFCGQGRGSQACDPVGSQTTRIDAQGAGSTRLPVSPTVACPCAVRASTALSDVFRELPVRLVGEPVPVTAAPTIADPNAPRPASALLVDPSLDRGESPFGTSTPATLQLRLTNRGTDAMELLSLSAAVGRTPESGRPVAVPPIGRLDAGETKTITVPVELEAPLLGRYVVFGQVAGVDRPVRFSVETTSWPWPAAAGVLLLLLIARFVRRRRAEPEGRSPSPVEDGQEMTTRWTEREGLPAAS